MRDTLTAAVTMVTGVDCPNTFRARADHLMLQESTQANEVLCCLAVWPHRQLHSLAAFISPKHDHMAPSQLVFLVQLSKP